MTIAIIHDKTNIVVVDRVTTIDHVLIRHIGRDSLIIQYDGTAVMANENVIYCCDANHAIYYYDVRFVVNDRDGHETEIDCQCDSYVTVMLSDNK